MTMCRWTVVAALAAGVFLGCNKPPAPVAAVPASAVTTPKPPPGPAADDALLTSGPPRGGVPITSMVPPPRTQPADASPAGTKKYVVKKGDTLINIARTELGNEHRVKDIQNLNPGLDPSKLRIGQEILIPAK